MTMPGGTDLREWLHRVRDEYWQQLQQTEAAGDVPGCSHVLFDVAGVRFAVEAPLCKGVLRRPRVTRLPGLPDHLLGIAGVRGEVVSVVDPQLFLSLPGQRPVGRQGFLLLLAQNGVKAALWVDRVADVVNLDLVRVVHAEAPWPGLPADLLLGQAGDEDKPLFVLDGAKLLTASAVG